MVFVISSATPLIHESPPAINSQWPLPISSSPCGVSFAFSIRTCLIALHHDTYLTAVRVGSCFVVPPPGAEAEEDSEDGMRMEAMDAPAHAMDVAAGGMMVASN